MSTEHNRALQHYLTPVMRREGFRKLRATWWKDCPGSIAGLNIQGSRFGPTLFLNLGVYFLELGTDARPAMETWHLRTRLESIIPEPIVALRLLEYSNVWGDSPAIEQRHAEIEDLLIRYGLPWLRTYSTLDAALADVKRAEPRGLQVAPSLRARFDAVPLTPHPPVS